MTRQEMRIRQEIESGDALGGRDQACELNHWVGPTGLTLHMDDYDPKNDLDMDITVSILIVDHFIRDMMR